MTREEAIRILPDMKGAGDEWDMALDMAITALQAQDVDAVSRQAVMWMLTNLSYTQCKTQGEVELIGLAKTMLIAMPSAQEVNNSNQEVNNSTATQPNGIESQASYRQVTGKLDVTDCISRQAAIDAVYKCANIFINNLPVMVDKADAYKALAELPSAQPERIQFADKDYVWIDGKQYISLQRFQKAVKEAQQEIIHCRDCKNCQIDSVFHDYWCDGRKVTKYHYCGYAERRTDE